MHRIEKLIVNSRLHSRSVARHAERMLQFVPLREGMRYLDAGCGNGAAAIYLAGRLPLEVTGIDADPEQIRAARVAAQALNQARFLVADATRLPFATGEFDIVATNKTTHHIPNWEHAFEEMARVLKPGGHLIYCDFVVPEWVAAAGKRLCGSLGWPAREKLNGLAARTGLVGVHCRRRLVNFDAVWRKGRSA
jgi:ubiquinone/menaquinone biosynthesis C-methylase UbiE